MALLAVVAFATCQRRPATTRATEQTPPTLEADLAPRPLALPDVLAGFTGGPIAHGPTWVRRRYARAATHVDTTVAIAQQPPGAFEGWLTMSRAGYPQAALPAPPTDVNGFYQCGEGPPPSCDLLIQMRSGVHLELRGDGTSSRADVDALARALPLGAWGAGRIDEPPH
jgi:hypothetical protein